MTIRVTLNCKLNELKNEELITFLQKNVPNVRQFKGNHHVNIFLDQQKNEMLIDEDWASETDHKNYLDFITENGVLGQLAAFLTEPPTIKYFKTLNV